MLKVLIKKQLVELLSGFGRNARTGKRRGKGGTVAILILIGFAYLAIGGAFFAMSSLFAVSMLVLDLDWLYFGMMGMIATVIGVLGSAFSTYSALYKAKDNDLLLSMPIPPSIILLSRIFSVYLLDIIGVALVFVPAIVCYQVVAGFSLPLLFCQIIVMIAVSLIALVLSCLLGFLIAKIAVRVKNKSFVTVVMSLVFIAVYYFVYFRMNDLIQSAVEYLDELSNTLSAIFPVQQMGLAAAGNPLPLIGVIIVSAGLFAALFAVLCKTFGHLATVNSGGKKAVYHRTETACRSLDAALLSKEAKRFTSSSVYMLNMGLGLLLLPILTVIVAIYSGRLLEQVTAFAALFPPITSLLPLALVAAVGLVASMNAVSAPSVSLEGKSFWIARSMPVPMTALLRAKLRFHLLLCGPITAVCTVAAGIILRLDWTSCLLATLTVLLLVLFLACLGLLVGTVHAFFDWTNESVPVKQSSAVMAALFGGWGVVLVIGVIGFLGVALLHVDVRLILATVSLLLIGGSALLLKGIFGKAADRLASM